MTVVHVDKNGLFFKWALCADWTQRSPLDAPVYKYLKSCIFETLVKCQTTKCITSCELEIYQSKLHTNAEWVNAKLQNSKNLKSTASRFNTFARQAVLQTIVCLGVLSLVVTLMYSRMIKKLLVIAGLINVMQLQTLPLPYVLNPPNPRTYKNEGRIRVVTSGFPNFKIALKFVDKNYTYCWWVRKNVTNAYTLRKAIPIFRKYQNCSGLRYFNNKTLSVACSLSIEKIGKKSVLYIETTLTEAITSGIHSLGLYRIDCTVENASSKYPPPDNNNIKISQACQVLFSGEQKF